MANQNLWLAEMGYLTMQRLMSPHMHAAGSHEPDFEELPQIVREAWIAATAAIRRRVVTWGLTAEQEDGPPDEITSLIMLYANWRRVPAEDRRRFLLEMTTPAERRALCTGLDTDAPPC